MPHRPAPSEEKLPEAFAARLSAATTPRIVLAVTVFGSRGRGDSGPDSDLDVAVDVAAGADQRALQTLAVDLATDFMMEREAEALGLARVVLAPGPLWGLRAAVARDGLRIWRRAA